MCYGFQRVAHLIPQCTHKIILEDDLCCRLGDDYKRWATDPNYRQARKAAAKQESVHR